MKGRVLLALLCSIVGALFALTAVGAAPNSSTWSAVVLPTSGVPTPVCPLTPLYRMYTLQDSDAPASYLQGGTCYVISDDFPSAARQAALCSYPFSGSGWVFQADHVPYAGYVYRDCNGHIIYGWPDWKPEWYLPEYAR